MSEPFDASPEFFADLRADDAGEGINGFKLGIKLDCADFDDFIYKAVCFLCICIIPFEVKDNKLHQNIPLT